MAEEYSNFDRQIEILFKFSNNYRILSSSLPMRTDDGEVVYRVGNQIVENTIIDHYHVGDNIINFDLQLPNVVCIVCRDISVPLPESVTKVAILDITVDNNEYIRNCYNLKQLTLTSLHQPRFDLLPLQITRLYLCDFDNNCTKISVSHLGNLINLTELACCPISLYTFVELSHLNIKWLKIQTCDSNCDIVRDKRILNLLLLNVFSLRSLVVIIDTNFDLKIIDCEKLNITEHIAIYNKCPYNDVLLIGKIYIPSVLLTRVNCSRLKLKNTNTLYLNRVDEFQLKRKYYKSLHNLCTSSNRYVDVQIDNLESLSLYIVRHTTYYINENIRILKIINHEYNDSSYKKIEIPHFNSIYGLFISGYEDVLEKIQYFHELQWAILNIINQSVDLYVHLPMSLVLLITNLNPRKINNINQLTVIVLDRDRSDNDVIHSLNLEEYTYFPLANNLYAYMKDKLNDHVLNNFMNEMIRKKYVNKHLCSHVLI